MIDDHILKDETTDRYDKALERANEFLNQPKKRKNKLKN